jgi:hypothetical protein
LKTRVAIVVTDLMQRGGVPAVGVFLHEAIKRSGRSIEVEGRPYLEVYDRPLGIKAIDVPCEDQPHALLGEA